jgi:hypothetical protein
VILEVPGRDEVEDLLRGVLHDAFGSDDGHGTPTIHAGQRETLPGNTAQVKP